MLKTYTPKSPNILTILKKIIALSPSNKIEAYVCSPLQFVKVPFQIKKILGETYPVLFYFPLPPMDVNQSVEAVESTIKPFAHSFGIYKEMDAMLENSRFAWLPGCVDPYLGFEKLLAASHYLTALFDHDDGIDLELLSESNMPLTLKSINIRLEEVLTGSPVMETDIPRVKAMGHVYQTYFCPLIEKGIDYTFFTKTLKQYLQSTELEVAAHATGSIDEAFYEENRRYTGGAGNAFALMCFLNEINAAQLIENHLSFGHAFQMVVDSVGILNDLYSLPKEIKEIQKKLAEQGLAPNDPEQIKSQVSSNIVLIKWKDGLSMQDAISETVHMYEKKINGFKKAIRLLQEDLPGKLELQKGVYCLEGWVFGHPTWALGSGRYNDKATLTTEDYVLFLHDLKKFSY